jgi:SRSO17 transposase
VQRQYTGTAGRVENAQVGVYLVYAGAGGHAFIDRALYLPRSWTENAQRLRAAGVPEGAYPVVAGHPAGYHQAIDLAASLPPQSWQRLSAGPGAKGHRYHDWAWVEITVDEAPGRHWLLIRRNARTGELAFYRAHAPRPVPLHVLARVAGRRWAVGESFQAGKELAGLDEHQVRRWTS